MEKVIIFSIIRDFFSTPIFNFNIFFRISYYIHSPLIEKKLISNIYTQNIPI